MNTPQDEAAALATAPSGREPSAANPPQGVDQKAEAHFLADEFGIPAIDAAEMLVSDPSEAQALASTVLAEERQRDPLAGVPVPRPDKDIAHLEKEVADLEKPVVHESSAPT